MLLEKHSFLTVIVNPDDTSPVVAICIAVKREQHVRVPKQKSWSLSVNP
jgi:hypothetical protein